MSNNVGSTLIQRINVASTLFERCVSAGDLVFYVSFNIVLVISIQCRGDKERYREAPYSNGLRSTLMRFYKRPGG